ncbi:MAG TPA: hypothetical protein VJO35_18830 [Terriglobales bacterium]|nr:hypothetical protein [Terriglobales bacterium]
MSISIEHVRRLQSLGYNERESRFLYLVATHSGYFVARQFVTFRGQQKGCMLDRFIARLIDSKHARAIPYGRTRVFNLYSRQIYGELEKDNLRNRRQLSDELIHTRLLILDFVLAQPERDYLETESTKLAYFHRQLNIPLSVLPGHLYVGLKALATTKRYFVDRFPVFLTRVADGLNGQTRLPTFTYCDSHQCNLKPLREHLRSYQAFLRKLPGFEFIYAAPDPIKLERARRMFRRIFDSAAPVSASELIRYFTLRRLWEEKKYNSLTREDRDRLRAGNARYRTEHFESLYRQWQSGGLSETEIDAAFDSHLALSRITFRTRLLPDRYDIFVRRAGPKYRTKSRNAGSTAGSTPEATAVEESR